jgi:hypothetical protein
MNKGPELTTKIKVPILRKVDDDKPPNPFLSAHRRVQRNQHVAPIDQSSLIR